jgi:hypothetical protein
MSEKHHNFFFDFDFFPTFLKTNNLVQAFVLRIKYERSQRPRLMLVIYKSLDTVVDGKPDPKITPNTLGFTSRDQKNTSGKNCPSNLFVYYQYYKKFKAERDFWLKSDQAERNAERIGEKLVSFVNALQKASNVVTKREGRRELAIGLQEQSQLRLKNLKKVKGNCVNTIQIYFLFSRHA